MRRADPFVSFIVPVRNDARRLRRCLASIREARYPADRLELIVADNGSTDGSDEVAREADAVVLCLPGLRVAELRNRAVRAATGDIVAFADADHEIDPEWIRAAVETLQQPNVAAVGAHYDAPLDSTWVQRQYDRLRCRHDGVREVEWLPSGNMALWRGAFDAANGFDTGLETCEDVELCHRLRAGGGRIVSDARLKSTHFGDPATLRDLFFGELWRGRDNMRVTLRTPRTARAMASLLVPAIELGLLAFVVLGMLLVASGGLPVALAAAAGIVLLTGIQSWRMLHVHRPVAAVDLVQTPAVACVYGVARALALVVRAPHAVRRRGGRDRA